MAQQAKAFARGQFYIKGAQITTSNTQFVGFHVCLADHISGAGSPPPPGESTHLWHWSVDMSLLK